MKQNLCVTIDRKFIQQIDKIAAMWDIKRSTIINNILEKHFNGDSNVVPESKTSECRNPGRPRSV